MTRRPIRPGTSIRSRRGLRRALPEQVFRIFDIGDKPLAPLVKSRPILGRRDLARGAVEQACANARLQFLHRCRNRGARNAKRIGGPREARTVYDTREDTEQVDAIQWTSFTVRIF